MGDGVTTSGVGDSVTVISSHVRLIIASSACDSFVTRVTAYVPRNRNRLVTCRALRVKGDKLIFTVDKGDDVTLSMATVRSVKVDKDECSVKIETNNGGVFELTFGLDGDLEKMAEILRDDADDKADDEDEKAAT